MLTAGATFPSQECSKERRCGGSTEELLLLSGSSSPTYGAGLFVCFLELCPIQEVDLVTRLTLPLAGPTPEDLTEQEVEGLPLDLQYLDEDKEIEEDLDIR